MKPMSDASLAGIYGGNYGDSLQEERTMHAMYWIGDVVEVYNSFFHWTTRRATIIYLHFNGIGEPYSYQVQFEDGSTKWVEASDIEFDVCAKHGC